MTNLADKKVAVIGTGATPSSACPRLAAYAEHALRVPAHAVVRRLAAQPADRPRVVGHRSSRVAAPAARELRRRRPPGRPVEVDLIDDGWTDIFRAICVAEGREPAEDRRGARPRRRARRLGQKMEELRHRVDETVADPATAEALKPYYRVMCKRPTFNDEYLRVLQPRQRHAGRRERVQGRRAHHRARAWWPTGRSTRSTCIVYASGFEISRRVPSPPRHRGQRPRRPVAVRPLGRRAARRCTASAPAGSRTGSTSASRRTRSA